MVHRNCPAVSLHITPGGRLSYPSYHSSKQREVSVINRQHTPRVRSDSSSSRDASSTLRSQARRQISYAVSRERYWCTSWRRDILVLLVLHHQVQQHHSNFRRRHLNRGVQRWTRQPVFRVHISVEYPVVNSSSTYISPKNAQQLPLSMGLGQQRGWSERTSKRCLFPPLCLSEA